MQRISFHRDVHQPTGDEHHVLFSGVFVDLADCCQIIFRAGVFARHLLRFFLPRFPVLCDIIQNLLLPDLLHSLIVTAL